MADTNPAALLTSAAITNPTHLATSIANNGWTDWAQNLSPVIQGQLQNTTNATTNIANNNLAAAGANQAAAAGMASDYNNIYRPAGEKLSGLVDQFGTEAYKDQQRGKAMADVQQQISGQQDQNSRAMSRMGVNPSSGRALAMNNQMAIQGAAAKAGAANASDDRVLAQYTSGLKDMNSLGLETAKTGFAADASGQKWSALGMDASQAGLKSAMDYATLAGNQADKYGNVAARAGYMANSDATTASNIQAVNDSNSIPNLLLSGVVKAGTNYLDKNVTSGLDSLWKNITTTKPTVAGDATQPAQDIWDTWTPPEGDVGGQLDANAQFDFDWDNATTYD